MRHPIEPAPPLQEKFSAVLPDQLLADGWTDTKIERAHVGVVRSRACFRKFLPQQPSRINRVPTGIPEGPPKQITVLCCSAC